MNHLQKLKNNSLCSVITKNKMLSVLLVGVMMCGSIPLGFSEPILKQWENTQDITQISCNDIKHVLVMRSNGEPACVTERTADKLGWEIIETISSQESLIIDSTTSINNYNKDYLKNLATIDYETNDKNTSSAPSYYSPGWSTTEISKIPKLGDVFEISVTAQADPPNIRSHDMRVGISDHFEFVNDSLPENVQLSTHLDRTRAIVYTDDVETGHLVIQIKAIKEGYGLVYGSALYEDADAGYLIYVDKYNSFYYDDGDEPTVNQPPRPDYGITWEDTVMLTKQNSGAASPSSSNDNEIIPEYTQQQVEELGLSRINWEDHIDDKSFYGVMPQAENVKTTVITPTSISAGSTENITVTLESINRLNDYEHVLVDVKFGPGIELDAQKINDPDCVGCEKYDVYNNDIFAIGLNNSATIDYPIKATKTGTWMLNFVVNGEFERHSILVE